MIEGNGQERAAFFFLQWIYIFAAFDSIFHIIEFIYTAAADISWFWTKVKENK